MAIIQSLYRYPIKGLNGQQLPSVNLDPMAGIEGDRRFAIRHGQTQFDPGAPKHLSKTKFLALMTHAELAELSATFGENEADLLLKKNNHTVFEGNLTKPEDINELEAYIAEQYGDKCKGSPKLVSAPDHMFSDVPEKCLSVVNLASVKALGDEVGAQLDPLRFRANIYLDGLPAWAERDWQPNMRFQAGNITFSVFKHIVRCNAVNVNLESAKVDQNLPKALSKSFDANLMGVYLFVETAGKANEGDLFSVVQ